MTANRTDGFDAFTMALRFLRRDWRSGELRLLAVAIVIAVASVTAVGFFTDRVEKAMTRQASEVLAADLVIEHSDRPDESLASQARALGLSTARVLSFPSVILADKATQLVQVKGVSAEYPLRGHLRLADGPAQAGAPAKGAPKPGEAWVEGRILSLLDVAVGDRVELGQLSLRISRVLAHEPDRAANLFRLAPRIMVNLDDMAESGLLGPASRVRHRLLVAGDAAVIEDFRQWAKSRIPDGARLEDVRAARPEIRDALDQGGRFLKLAAVTATLLCIVAVALSTRRFVSRQADASALLRCLGASKRRINTVFALRLLMLGLLASLVGGVLGYLTQPALVALLGGWFAEKLPAPSAWPLVMGTATGILVLAGFALPSILRLGSVPPLRVFRRDLDAPNLSQWISIGVAVGALVLLLTWQIGDDRLSLRLIGGLSGAIVLLLITARLLITLLAPLRQRLGGSWRYGLASLARQPSTTAFQLTGFGLGITALLLLAMVRLDLLSAWQQELPPDTPNHFLINIQPSEVESLSDLLHQRGIEIGGPYPMSRARLTAIGERKVNPNDYANPRARRLAEREFNLSWSEDPQPDNRITEGEWWTPAEGEQSDAFSVETGIADTLGIQLGDILTFDLAGETIRAPVTSLREVQWDSFNANFFVVATPKLLRERPATYIASFHLKSDHANVLRDIVRNYPSVTPLDVTALIAQVRGIMDRGALAVELVFGFTLVAGLVVLVAGIQASRELRTQEAAVLRTLGMRRRKLLQSVALEFGLLGALAGLIAAAAATGVSYALATAVFNLPWNLDFSMWLIAVVGGAVGVAFAGLTATWKLTREPPVVILRDA